MLDTASRVMPLGPWGPIERWLCRLPFWAFSSAVFYSPQIASFLNQCPAVDEMHPFSRAGQVAVPPLFCEVGALILPSLCLPPNLVS